MKLYYTAPSDECFEDLRRASLSIWSGYDFAEDKIERVTRMTNISDNFMFMFCMFDHINQSKAVILVNESTRNALRERIIAGNSAEFLELIGL